MKNNDQRLIEDDIPIEEISQEARREKSIRKGYISTLHLWWARRMLVAARAVMYEPPVMILDEATSSIDTRTEQLIMKGMNALMLERVFAGEL